jgi:hypothetical protein
MTTRVYTVLHGITSQWTRFRAVGFTWSLAAYRNGLQVTGMVWVSWPKKSARVPTEITQDVVREVALRLGFVDVMVCAIDEVWSGLRLVVRKELR